MESEKKEQQSIEERVAYRFSIVDKNMSLRGSNQIATQVMRSYIIQVASYSEGCIGFRPFGWNVLRLLNLLSESRA